MLNAYASPLKLGVQGEVWNATFNLSPLNSGPSLEALGQRAQCGNLWLKAIEEPEVVSSTF